MADNIDVNKNPKQILGQLIGQGGNVFEQIKKEEGEKVLRAFLKSKGEEAIEQGGAEQLAQSISQPQEQAQQAPDFQDQQVNRTVPRAELSTATSPIGKFFDAFLSKDARALAKEKSALENEALRQEIEMTNPLSVLESVSKIEKSGQLTPNNIFTKWEPVANNFQSVVDSFARVKASVDEPSAAGDLALIFNYMKILDPGSVVRESEFANAAASGSLGERFVAAGKRLAAGERLSPTMRKDFENRASKLFESNKRQYQASERNMRAISSRNGVNPDAVIRSVEFIKDKSEEVKSPLSGMSDEELRAIAEGK